MTTTTTHPTTSTLAGFMQGRSWIGHADEALTFDGAVPREEAMRLLSYPLIKADVTATAITPDGVISVTDPSRKAVVRADTGVIFGIFKSGYQIHEPQQWCLETLELVFDSGLEIGTVALTKGGARAFLQAETPEGRIATAPGAEPVPHRPHVTAATSHDGSIATTYSVGTRVIICENELGAGGAHALLGSGSGVHKVRHTSQSGGRVLAIRESLGVVVEQVGDAFDAQFRKLVSEYVSDARWREFVRAYTGVDKAKEGRSKTMAQAKVDALNTLWRDDERAAPWRNSAYGVLAAMNTAAHHVFGADKNRTERNQNKTIEGEWEAFDRNVLRLLATV